MDDALAKACSLLMKWLERHQVPSTALEVSDKYLQINRPDGRIIKVLPLSDKIRSFRLEGLAIDSKHSGIELIDEGGIWDPISRCILGEHYSASFYAMACAYAISRGEEEYREPLMRTLRFCHRTFDSEYNPFRRWEFHWEFNQLAIWETAHVLGKELIEYEFPGLLKERPLSFNPAANWCAMRLRISQLKHVSIVKLSQSRDFFCLKACQDKDGLIFEYPGTAFSTQYHCYCAALLARLSIDGWDEAREMAIRAAEALLLFPEADGDIILYGRGARQIFGMAAAIYLLTHANIWFPNNCFIKDLRSKTIKFLLSYQRSSGVFPLTLNFASINDRCGWYDYNHLSVYNAFLAALLQWTLFLSGQIMHSSKKSFLVKKSSKNICIQRSSNTTVAMWTGPYKFPENACLTLNPIYFVGIGTIAGAPGYPPENRWGISQRGRGVDENFCTPLVFKRNKWFHPLQCQKSHQANAYISRYGGIQINRRIIASNDLIGVFDRIELLEKDTFDKLRLFQWVYPIDKLMIKRSPEGWIAFTGDGETIQLEITITGCSSPTFFKRKSPIPTPLGWCGIIGIICKPRQNLQNPITIAAKWIRER